MATSRKTFIKQVAKGAAGISFLSSLGSLNKAIGREINNLQLNDFSALKNEYMLANDITYLNHASIGTIPKAVHGARNAYLELCETNPWQYMWGDAWDEPREEVRKKTASFLNCSADEITLTHNTTETFNLLAQGLALGAGDEVLFSNLNHAGASICFEKFAAKRGYTVNTFNIPVLKTPNLSKADILNLYEQHITPRTKLLVLPHIDNTVGIRQPLQEITALARSKGVDYVAVDAAQTVGMIPVDVKESGIDVLATSAHKWLQAPKGISLAFISERIQEELQPMWVTWGQNQESWEGTARIYEDYGTRNLPELLTLGPVIDFHQKIDWNKREAHLHSLWKTAQKMADESSATDWASPRKWELSGSLYAIEIKNMKSGEFFQKMFDKHGFVFRPFENMGLNTVRISPNLLNTEENLNRFFEMANKT